ncbi:type I-E CRISPR-associated protein Cas7/Cse4/CasC [Streptacidiphilus sp. ASG 303]|uniref:type I-E CRISPR-associated protein Cas7/Cse4/CasC n=1 Tax=Streptacidiphilus sp. ASG 303 TaxID=2896847 RepID=UPI001E65C50C|nr:type I-E CRISPR-associated protein Cas7/Cse4/CasC [Streptacidiphilus sp. ASG 303]MCD0485203.1 type I-E CRISPR-associated protein Cas7/Cse4/CasC [Streptacidiphilus sp. ASG 303]
MSMFLDLHALQSVPAANLNRDDLGSPKTVRYGNADRIRVSSQSWKRVMRHGVERELGETAARTRLVPVKVKESLARKGWDADAAAFAGAQIAACAGDKGLKTEDAGHTSVLLFLPAVGIDELVALCEEHRAALEQAAVKKPAKNAKPAQLLPTDQVAAVLKRRTASISLFGRMLAELPGANVDGAAQVAHAMTTHASEPQRDYFTAVDDWLGEAETGSGHLSTAEFGAGVFYRFASVNLDDLLTNLEGDRKTARALVGVFADQFLMSLPQAKKNSTAPHTIPDLAYLAVREHRPVSMAAAFETPVRPDAAGGFSAPSRKALADYAATVDRLTGGRHRSFHAHAGVQTLDGLGTPYDSFPELITAAVDAALPSAEAQA